MKQTITPGMLPALACQRIALALTPHALKDRFPDALRAIDHNPTMEMDHALYDIAVAVKNIQLCLFVVCCCHW
jgi:hypothetical protein